MFALVGIVIVCVSVIGGYILEGGNVKVLIQPAEFIIIGGAILGALLISAPGPLLKKIFKKSIGVVLPKKKQSEKELYMYVLGVMYDFFQLSRTEGLLAIEKHIEDPDNSEIFQKYPAVLAKKDIVYFLCDSFRLMLVGDLPSHDLESIMESDAEVRLHEGMKPANIVQKMGDSLPGLGIVAAVLGIVITMQAIDGPPEEIGHKVGAALVGTFLGVLMSYGFIQPIATHLELENEEEVKILEVIKAGLTAFSKGLHPLYAVEFARRGILTDMRPTFLQMEERLKEVKQTANVEGNSVGGGA